MAPVKRLMALRLSPEDGSRLEPGAILVVPATAPAWTPLFARASNVIVELGGMLSHSGIVRTVTRAGGSLLPGRTELQDSQPGWT